VAEMTVFFGAFQHPDLFHRVATIVAAASIVITAVYILRVIAILLLGEVRNEHHLELSDAKWYEKFSVGLLIAGITAIGMFPLWLSDMIMNSLAPIVERLAAAM